MATNATRRGKLAAVIQVTSGNFLEMFDFFLFGVYASYIAKAFFPSDSQFVSLMSAFLSFAAACGLVATLALYAGRPREAAAPARA
jgi:MHS family citrate/tricarballylate:H+ symporter-like MFS transporter